jgi:UDP-glucose 4-epimerase
MRRAICRAMTRSFGDGVHIGRGVLWKHPETFEIGSGVFIGDQAVLQGRFDGRCVIGDPCGSDRRVFDARDLVMRSPSDGATGPACSARCTRCSCRHPDHPDRPRDQPVRIRAWADIGVSAVVLPGVTVGQGAIVGAGAVVTTMSSRSPSWPGTGAIPAAAGGRSRRGDQVKIDNSTIVVTGGAGLIGSTTIDQLLRLHSPARVTIFDNFSRGTRANIAAAVKDPRVRIVEGDIRDREAVARVLDGADALVHMAALRITACAAQPREAFEVMCEGTFNLVEAAQRAGVNKVVAASTASVYGLAETFPTRETHHPYDNRTWYGAAKVMLEGLLRSYNDMYGLPYVALRYFNVYGPRMDIHGKYTEVLIRWMERLDAGQPPLILGDGTQTMDFVYVDDVARANVLALAGEASDEVFNVASGVETSLNDLAAALSRVMNVRRAPEYGPERKVNAVPPRRLASTEKAERMLGFRTSIPLEEGLSRLVEWWRAERVRA